MRGWKNIQIVFDLVSLAEALWVIGGAVICALGTLISGRRYKQRIAALGDEDGTADHHLPNAERLHRVIPCWRGSPRCSAP